MLLDFKTILDWRVNKGQNQLSQIAVTLKNEDFFLSLGTRRLFFGRISLTGTNSSWRNHEFFLNSNTLKRIKTQSLLANKRTTNKNGYAFVCLLQVITSKKNKVAQPNHTWQFAFCPRNRLWWWSCHRPVARGQTFPSDLERRPPVVAHFVEGPGSADRVQMKTVSPGSFSGPRTAPDLSGLWIF